MGNKVKKERRKYLDQDGNRLPGVTTILDEIAKPALGYWAANTAADATARAVAIGGMPPEEAARAGAHSVWVERDRSAALGTMTHDYVEQWVSDGAITRSGTDDDECRAYVCAMRIIDHLKKTTDEIPISEKAFVSRLGYGGTIDLVIRRGERRYLADIKTGKGVYQETVAQLAAYCALLRDHGEHVDGAIIIHAPIDTEIIKEIVIPDEELMAGLAMFVGAFGVYSARKKIQCTAKGGDE